MNTLVPIISEVEIFQGMKPEHLGLIAGCASNVRFEPGEYVGRIGDRADHFWIIRQGRMALELYGSGSRVVTVSTMSEGDVVGFSWLLPPYQLRFDIHVLTSCRALLFDGHCLRGKCVADPEFGYEILCRFSRIIVDHIQTMSLQLMDIYGDHPIESE